MVKKAITLFMAVGMFVGAAYAGQNADASIWVDFNLQAGDQSVNSIDAPGVDATVEFEARVANCSQLDSYSFELRYRTADLLFISFSPKNTPREDNILNQHGNYLLNSQIIDVDESGALGVVTVSVVNNTDNPAYAASGEGLLGVVEFLTRVAAPQSIQFGEVKWKDAGGVTDYCSEENKSEAFMGGGSLPVKLSSFIARTGNKAVILEWTTESEKDSRGFNIYRSENTEGDYERVNGQLVQAAGNSTSRRNYSYTDTRVEIGKTYFYKLQQIDLSGTTSFFGPVTLTVGSGSSLPESFVLYPNFPNPFNPETRLKFDLPQAEHVTVEIYSITGVKVCTLLDSDYAAGEHEVQWTGTNDQGERVASGAYLYKFRAGEFVRNGKMMFLN